MIKKPLIAILTAILITAGLGPLHAAQAEPLDRFQPGEPWRDTSGAIIQAHGGQVVPATDEAGKKIYYWYGEDRSNGYARSPGVHVYSSYDLYNWTDRGLALRAMENVGQFETDAYFRELYADYDADQRKAVYRDLGTTPPSATVPGAILERPKVIYNARTKTWVMWIHTDGPSTTSNAQYAKATAGVAVSSSPFGPFRYIDSYRLHVAPAGEPNYQPDNPGMARDMNLFLDDDGTAYLIYSSEENYSLFISKLDDDYTALATPPDRAVKGVDFTRPYIGAHREAPAIFKFDGTYYLITSGATGWNPNPARYATATDLLGSWTDHGNPITGSGSENTHRSQSTSVIPVDPENGKFIFMGDRWTPSTLATSPYVWLPVVIGEGNSISLGAPDPWRWQDLPSTSRYQVQTTMPETVRLGKRISLPPRVEVQESGRTSRHQVSWDTSGVNKPGPMPVVGTLADGRRFTRTVVAVPDQVLYLAHAGGAQTADWKTIMREASRQGRPLNSVADQLFGPDPVTGKSWGHDGAPSGTYGNEESTIYTGLRWAKDKKPLRYRFTDLEPGSYDVWLGYYDPWPYANRAARVSVNEQVVEHNRLFTGQPAAGRYVTEVGPDGEIDVVVAPTRSPDIQLSYVLITRS